MNNKVSEIQVSYSSNMNLSTAPKITSSLSATEVLLDNWDLGEIEFRESFKILLLNRSNRVKGVFEVSKGGLNSTVVDPKIVFSVALKTLASGIILCHNHPSGNVKPSNEDIALTKKLKEAGKYLDIDVLDHIIITPDRSYYSFADEEMI